MFAKQIRVPDLRSTNLFKESVTLVDETGVADHIHKYHRLLSVFSVVVHLRLAYLSPVVYSLASEMFVSIDCAPKNNA